MSAVVKVVCDIQRIVRKGQRVYGGVASGDENGFLDCEFVPRRLLFDEARLTEQPEKLSAAAIRRGQLRCVDFDSEIIYFKGADGCQAMLDGLDADGTFFYGGSAGSFADIGGDGPDADRLGQIGADENHAGIDRGRAKNYRRLFAAKQALAAKRCRGRYRLLQFHFFVFTTNDLAIPLRPDKYFLFLFLFYFIFFRYDPASASF